jgi:hypothetical protein
MGFTKEEMTAHGFRAMASSILNEAGYNPDVIEMQLAHVFANKIQTAYNCAQYLPEQYKLMQDWAETCWMPSNRRKARCGKKCSKAGTEDYFLFWGGIFFARLVLANQYVLQAQQKSPRPLGRGLLI